VASLHPTKPVTVRPGGESRQASVRAGIAALGECDYVLVHDAARPLASPSLVRRVLAAAMESEAAFPAIAPRDAVKRIEGNLLMESLDRSRIVLAQTPQGFSYSLLARAHREAADAGLVGDDDAQLVAATGHAVQVEGEPERQAQYAQAWRRRGPDQSRNRTRENGRRLTYASAGRRDHRWASSTPPGSTATGRRRAHARSYRFGARGRGTGRHDAHFLRTTRATAAP
jgi:hypothetical protein